MDWMFLPFKRYAEFSGRSRRKEYWMFALFLFLAYMAFIILMMALGASAMMSLGAGSTAGLGGFGGGLMILVAAGVIFWLAVLIPSIAVGVRRLHDTDRTGWWLAGPIALSALSVVFTGTGLDMLLSLGSVVLSVVLIVFYCLDGTPGPNRYGPDPKGRADAAHLGEVFS